MIPPEEISAIILACNDPETGEGIETALRDDRTLDIHRAQDGPGAMKLASEIDADLIICPVQAYRSYIEGCKEVGGEDPSRLAPLFLLLSDGIGKADIARAVEDGADDFVGRDECKEILLLKVRSLIRQRHLRQKLWREERRLEEAKDLIDRNFKELTTILLKILEVRVPGASDRAETAKNIASSLAQELGLGEEKRRTIIFAAQLHEIGKVGLPDEAASKHQCAIPASLVTVFQQHVTVGSMIISAITGYREAAEAVGHQLENYDGSGFPDELMGEEIPIGARILRAIVLQEELRAEGLPVERVIERIRSAMHTVLEQRIANLLIEFLSSRGPEQNTGETKMPVEGLAPGMVIARDVFAASGVKLLPKGIQLSEKTLALLLERNEMDPVIGGVYVVSQVQP